MESSIWWLVEECSEIVVVVESSIWWLVEGETEADVDGDAARGTTAHMVAQLLSSAGLRRVILYVLGSNGKKEGEGQRDFKSDVFSASSDADERGGSKCGKVGTGDGICGKERR